MKVFLIELKDQSLALLGLAGKKILRHWLVFFIAFPVSTIICATLLFPEDIRISERYSQAKKEHRSTYNLMKKVSKYGDFGGVAVTCGLIVVAGKLCGRKRLMLAGLAGILAASTAGLLNSGIKLSGRPRPDTRKENNMEDKFYGPRLNKSHTWFDSHYQSFASGHTTTAFGAAAGVGLTLPALAIPAFAGASLVAFSRIYLHDHFPSDVVAGALIGILFGLAFSMAAKEMLASGSKTVEKKLGIEDHQHIRE